MRETRLVSIRGVPMLIFQSPECISDDIVKYNDFWEFELFKSWSSMFDVDGLILDIGANIGSHTLQFKHYFPDCKIWAFELHHENYNLLKKNTASYKDVKSFNVGVGSRTSIVTYNDGHFSNCGVVKLDQHGSNDNIVLAIDDLKQTEPISLIKIDVEGHELSAFEGMQTTLRRDQPQIWLEDLSSQKLAVAFLKDLGYEILRENTKTDDFFMVHKHNRNAL